MWEAFDHIENNLNQLTSIKLNKCIWNNIGHWANHHGDKILSLQRLDWRWVHGNQRAIFKRCKIIITAGGLRIIMILFWLVTVCQILSALYLVSCSQESYSQNHPNFAGEATEAERLNSWPRLQLAGCKLGVPTRRVLGNHRGDTLKKCFANFDAY